MKNKILLSIAIFLSFILIVVISLNKQTNHSFFNNETNITIKNKDNTLENINLEEYVIGVVAGEMPASFNIEALKAQAVASRTYAIYKINQNKNKNYDILTDITNQVYITQEEMQKKWGTNYSKYYEKIKNAVLTTQNEIITYNNEVIEAFYFSMSNGQTEDSLSVFGENLPYIKSTISAWDNKDLNNFEFTITYSLDEFCKRLDINNCNSINISEINRNNTNHIDYVIINNKKILGTKLREKLSLRSTDITFKINNNDIELTTKGYGHGVGMSQYGANGMANDGYTYQEILKYYYNDISINKIV